MLITVLGNLGSGKTLFLVINAYYSKLPIVSNFALDFGNREIIPFDLNKFLRKDYSDCIILMDEAYNYLESRISATERNRIMSYFLFQSRKKNVLLYITAQLFSTLDRRYRELSDLIVVASNMDEYFLYTIYIGSEVNEITISKEYTKLFYKMYNTKELIDNADEKMKYNLKVGQEKMINIEELANEVLDFYISEGLTKITRDMIEIYLEANDIENFYAKRIFTMLKIRKMKELNQKKRKIKK
jgi:hypothetical protein